MSVNRVNSSDGSLTPIATRGQTIQFSAMPTASADYLNRVVQYIGATTSEYTNGYFYKCVLDGANYIWQNVPLGGSGGESYFKDLLDVDFDESTLDDGDIPVYNESTEKWENSHAIPLAISQLQGSLLTKASKVSSPTSGNLAGLNSSGDITDSGIKMSPTPAESQADPTLFVTRVNAATTSNSDVPSLYTIQKFSNTMTKRIVVTGASIGSTGIGTWSDSATPDESTWLTISNLVGIDNANDIDVSLKFDPSSGEPITLGGYIIDTTTGKMCIKFGNRLSNPSAAKVAIDITYTRNNVS